MLEIDTLTKTYGEGPDAVRALGSITFDVQPGELLSVVGPSGCGKTTLLKCLSGLLAPTSGVATFEGVPITSPPEGLAMVFQDYGRSLMPWLTVVDNGAFPLRNMGVGKRERRARAAEALTSVGVGDFAEKYPWQLSGGMQQRVAIARALAYRPSVLLMDEPFASVDAQTRIDLEDLTLTVRDEFGITMVFVTHDIDEAIYLGDRVVVLSSAPTTVDRIVDVELPHPRDQVGTKAMAEFANMRGEIFTAIRRPDAGVPVLNGATTAPLGDGGELT